MIDNDIFQIVTLVLLLLALIVALVSLSTIGKLRKELEERTSEATLERARWAAAGTSSSAAWGGESETGATAATPEPVAAHPLETASAAEPGPGTAAGVGTATGAAAAGMQAQTQPAAADEPQDQPFERDGRWWFKRGDELLVYDEGTGQWQPAPAEAGAGAGAEGTTPMPAVGEGGAGQEVGAHWKCPTCGAVNGSTATSCRMCFTPRP